jgi:uncharacterized protein YdhG (YjbR/CyaY superfamily)
VSPADTSGPDDVDRYLLAAPSPQRETLEQLRATLLRLLPRATEAMRYGLPAVVLDDAGIAGYGSFRDHCGYFPFSGAVLEQAGDAIAGYETSKGGLRFSVDRPLPLRVVRRLVRLRLDELGAVSSGTCREYFDDGTIKARGRMRAGELTGDWQWFRKDGSLLRTGSFRAGEQCGTWTTYDRDGNAAKVTELG